MQSISTETHRTKYFHSVDEYQKFILSHMAVAGRYPMSQDRKNYGGQYWFGRNDFTDTHGAVRAMSNPTARQLDMAATQRAELMKEVMPEPKITRKRKQFTDDIGDVDVDRYLSGDSDFYRQSKTRIARGQKIISLWINNGYSWRVHSDEINWNAVTGIALVDILEEEGFAVELNVLNESHNSYRSGIRNCFIGCRIKSESEALNTSTAVGLISALGHRFAHFTAKTALGPNEVVKTLGTPQAEVDPGEFVDCKDTEYYFLPASVDRADAIKSVRNILKKIAASHSKG